MNSVKIRRVVHAIALRVCPDIKAQGEALEDARKRANMLASRCGELEQKLRDVSEYNSSLSDQLSEARKAGESIQAQFDATMAELKSTRDTLGRSHVLSVEAQAEAQDLRAQCKKLKETERTLREANHELIIKDRSRQKAFDALTEEAAILKRKLRETTQFIVDSVETIRAYRRGDESIRGVVEYLEADLDSLHKDGVLVLNPIKETT